MHLIYNLINELPLPQANSKSGFCRILSALFAVVVVASVSGFVVGRLRSLYIPICLICLFFVLSGGVKKIDWLFVGMYVVFFISALISEELTFKPLSRFALFLVITLLVGPGICSDRAALFRTYVFRYMLILLSILTLGSFFAYFLGINFMSKNASYNYDISVSGIFSGLYVHSMMLGPLSAIVSIMFLNSYLISKNKVFIILFFISASCVALSASRGAALSLAIPIIYVLFFYKNIRKTKLVFLILTCLLLSIPISDRLTSGIIQKQENNIQAGGTFSSREYKWENRIEEFDDNPIFGIGFGAVDSKNYEDYTDFSVEPGSSHLSVLSMTGLLGMILYCSLIFKAFRSIARKKNVIALNLTCMLIAMVVHATFEGYVLFGGAFLCLVYWLIIGLCVDYQWIKQRGLICKCVARQYYE